MDKFIETTKQAQAFCRGNELFLLEQREKLKFWQLWAQLKNSTKQIKNMSRILLIIKLELLHIESKRELLEGLRHEN